MIDKNFCEVSSNILTRLGFGNETIASLIQKWKFFIEECESGYAWDYSEYRNEIRVRWLLQNLLDSPEVCKFPEFKCFFDELFSLDERFRLLLQSGRAVVEGYNWWDRGVLARAGEEYCHYMEGAHGILVKNSDS
jgi:hypothetical protein